MMRRKDTQIVMRSIRNKYRIHVYNNLDSAIPRMNLEGYDLALLLNSIYFQLGVHNTMKKEYLGKLIKAIRIEIFIEIEEFEDLYLP